MKTRAFWVERPGVGVLRDAELGPPGPDQVQVRACWSGISRGTEATVFRGGVPDALADTMAAPFQEGRFPGPVKYGYASVGVVEAGRALPVGTPVFCLYPHQDRYQLPASAARPLPPGVPLRRAVLGANAETALNATWDARIGPGDRVAVVGGGVVGCLVAWLAGCIPGTRVVLVDTLPERADIATALGVDFALPADAPGDQDVVVHSSGSQAGLATALGLAGVEAIVLELSWYGDRPVSAPLGSNFHPRRLQLRSSQVGGLPPDRRPRWTFSRRLDTALTLLRDARLDALLEPDLPFESLPARMPAIAAQPGGLCHPVRYPESPP